VEAGATPDAHSGLKASGCAEPSGKDYSLKWRAQGESFFDGFDFETRDDNHGAAQYLDRCAVLYAEPNL
jgi:hypothetical protein